MYNDQEPIVRMICYAFSFLVIGAFLACGVCGYSPMGACRNCIFRCLHAVGLGGYTSCARIGQVVSETT